MTERSKAATKKLTEAVRNVREKTLGINQQEFAGIMDVTQQTVSAWETGEYAPSAEALMKLGNLAPYPDCEWFYIQAGGDRSKILAMGEQRLKEMGKAPAPGEIVEVPLLSMEEVTSGREGRLGTGRMRRLPSDLVVNRASTVTLLIDRDAPGIVFAAGDIVVVDRSSTDLRSLWNKVILVHLDPSEAPEASFLIRTWNKGPSMGVLKLDRWPSGILVAALHPLGTFEHEPLPIAIYSNPEMAKEFAKRKADRRETVRLAEEAERQRIILRKRRRDPDAGIEGPDLVEIKNAGLAKEAKLGPAPDEAEFMKQIERAARENTRPAAGCHVLGRMVCWFSAEARASEAR